MENRLCDRWAGLDSRNMSHGFNRINILASVFIVVDSRFYLLANVYMQIEIIPFLAKQTLQRVIFFLYHLGHETSQ